MNILVTGGAGFIGSHIVEALVDAGHDVTVLDNLRSGNPSFLPEGVPLVRGDVRNPHMIELFRHVTFDAVYHEAAQTQVPLSMEQPRYDADENVMGLVNVLEFCRKTGVKKVIFSSSAAVYGDVACVPVTEEVQPNPTSFYGLTKWMSERYLSLYRNAYGLDYTVLRYSNVYGPRQGNTGEGGVIYTFSRAMYEKKPLTIFGDGTQTRDFIYVKDVAAANVAALTKGGDDVFNISSGKETSIGDVLSIMRHNSHQPLGVTYTEPRKGDIYRSALENSKGCHGLEWKPRVAFEDGIGQTLAYVKATYSPEDKKNASHKKWEVVHAHG